MVHVVLKVELIVQNVTHGVQGAGSRTNANTNVFCDGPDLYIPEPGSLVIGGRPPSPAAGFAGRAT